MSYNHCRICNHLWRPRVENPAECPNCKNRNWEDRNQSKEIQELRQKKNMSVKEILMVKYNDIGNQLKELEEMEKARNLES